MYNDYLQTRTEIPSLKGNKSKIHDEHWLDFISIKDLFPGLSFKYLTRPMSEELFLNPRLVFKCIKREEIDARRFVSQGEID